MGRKAESERQPFVSIRESRVWNTKYTGHGFVIWKCFVISYVEHQCKVDYNVAVQIWLPYYDSEYAGGVK